MSKLAHSNDDTMREIELTRWLESEATNWHTASIRAALTKEVLGNPQNVAVEALYKELQEAGFFYKTNRHQWALTHPGRRVAERAYQQKARSE